LKTILLVEDDLMVQETISDYFSMKTSYKVVTAEDGEIALDQIENSTPDLILLDVLLPRINGLALLQDIRKIEKAKDIPVIFISGEMTDEADKKLGIELGAIDYFEKPIDFPLLLDRVNSVLSDYSPPEPVGGLGRFSIITVFASWISGLERSMIQFRQRPSCRVDQLVCRVR